jgi:tight adherence protein C
MKKERKGRRTKLWNEAGAGFPGLTKEQLLCIVTAAFLAALSLISSGGDGVLKDGNAILRDGPGGIERHYELKVGGISDSYVPVSITVSPREYTEKEAAELFDGLMDKIAVYIVGSNEDLDSIDTDLNFPSSVDGYDGVRISWYPENTSIIGYDGTVNNLKLEGPEETYIRVVLKTGEYSEEYVLPVRVIPAGTATAAEKRKKIEDLIQSADLEQVRNESLELPGELDGTVISYAEPRDRTWAGILAGGVFAAVLLGLKPKQDMLKKKKQRDLKLIMDYPDMVSKLIVYMGAGLTVRNAWIKITEDYKRDLESGHSGRREVYEEMSLTAADISKGVPEIRAYGEFARRCSNKSYMKLISILEQNLRTGDRGSENALQLEMQEAFEQRKNMAKRQGEEAVTKLMLPLGLSLIAVLIITAVPAMLTML